MMNRAIRLLILTGVTSATIGATALIATSASAAPSTNGAQHANAHSAAAQTIVTTPASAPTPGASTAASTASDLTSPQPASNADFSGNGANVHGPYDSTRDGSPSLNGNGGGKSVGKPCAGCVGKADNKNPKGQLPGGSDSNHGYECDSNHGIGRSNPAHTGCVTVVVTPPVVEPVPTPTLSTPSVGGGNPTPTVVESSPSVIPTVESSAPTVIDAPPPASTPAPSVAALVVRSHEHALANTGAPITTGVVAGLGFLLAGGLLTASGTRRRAH